MKGKKEIVRKHYHIFRSQVVETSLERCGNWQMWQGWQNRTARILLLQILLREKCGLSKSQRRVDCLQVI